MRMRQYIMMLMVAVAAVMSSCEDRVTDDVNARIDFSVDTLRFDTVFTQQGSVTKIVKVYNPQKKALNIRSVSLSQNSYFKLNIDGENNPANFNNILLRGGDSLFVFVKAVIDPQDAASPVLIEDSVVFLVNDNHQCLRLEAFGQDVEILRRDTFEGDITLGGGKPYLVFDTIIIKGNTRISKGTRFYMHDDAVMILYGGLRVEGTLQEPVVFRGDRFDNILRDIPYDYSSGKWGGIFLLQAEHAIVNPVYDINYLDLHSGMFGMFCQSVKTEFLPTLHIRNSRLHNFSVYGLVIQNMNAEIVNTEISNCADYCLYLSGGKHTLIHNTIANYFNFKKENVTIHSATREDVAAVYINDLSKNQVRTEAIFKNNIISGWRRNNLLVATALPDRYDGMFLCNFLRNDTLNTTLFPQNYYEQDTDTVFNRIYFSREEQTYYDFRLDSVSPARDIADSLTATKYPLDRDGRNRLLDGKPDAGCYEWQPEE